MVSKALHELMTWLEDKSAPSGHDDLSDAILKEVEWNECQIILKNGQPVITGNTASLDSDVLALLKENREQIIRNLKRKELATHQNDESNDNTESKSVSSGDTALPDGVVLCPRNDKAGIRRDRTTGKIHAVNNPDTNWLKGLGWEWSDTRGRMIAPYPHDKEDPPPQFFADAPKTGNRRTDDWRCSLCGFYGLYKKEDDYSDNWLCMICYARAHTIPAGSNNAGYSIRHEAA